MGKSSRSFSIKEIQDLPTLPTVACQVLAVAEDPKSSAQDLLEVIQIDPPLVAKVLRVANSGYFRRGQEISDLHKAIVHLGFPTVRNLALAVSVMNTVDNFFIGTRFNREGFWHHCTSVAALSKKLAEKRGGLFPATAFVVGLLHDIGKLILDRYCTSDFMQALFVAEHQDCSFLEAEQRTMKTDHAKLGEELLKEWGLPSIITDPIRWHHAPLDCPDSTRPYAAIVHIADYVCNIERIGYSGNSHPSFPSEVSWQEARIDLDGIHPLMEDLSEMTLSSALLGR